MRYNNILLLAVFSVSVIFLQACGKVSNETGPDQNSKKPIFYTTLVSQVPVKGKLPNGDFSLLPSENVLIVNLSQVNKDGGMSLVSWGKGMKERVSTAPVNEHRLIEYRSVSYGLDNNVVNKAAGDDVLVKWVKGNPEKWEYYIQFESMDNTAYVVNLMNYNGEKLASIPVDGKAVSANVTLELPAASYLTTLWARVLIADESKNIVKKTILKVEEIKNKYSDNIIRSLKYRPADMRVKKFNVINPQLNIPSDNSVEYFLSEILINNKKGDNYLQSYLKDIPREIIPTSTIILIKESLPKK
ncbi:MAG: hypothetical protein DKM50_11365 [Candidatus Margulisiibacteriota bacterium]|nr:MAG: hypothetical protein A2X43_12145 [Candidatus Margulisbacteria bacterium GWD2_39_127]OGI03207.1 MAG: hypothetical protein A2X42_11385 [Candidatus Margulisbacteria bacterium GWF2_38_17]OGI11231.1 MAG: hypothetical protein A2X41_03810 [Candidatus Margulisbacteria bacterium GWE2_39_32]PZM78554.1 MAG: hypothetical protein DKM50_11365 [Candidatus Margulisiibacteriota bacterium]HAR63879.1 hypothetical protein [Candidatus Margulisiibacteriota bacterium]